MALSDKYKKRREAVASAREQLAVARAQDSVQRIIQSEQFRLSALALPESKMAVDAIISQTVKDTLDPRGSLLDTMRAKGFRPAEIRAMIHRLYDAYCRPISEQGTPSDESYEVMLNDVALFMEEHQELYNTLNPDELRGA